MAAGLEIGGWFASAAICKLAGLVRSYISDQYEYQKGEKKKLESLQRSLIRIKAVIDSAERKGIKEDPNLLSWLNDLKDAVYDAEDVLDLFEYKSLEREAEPSGGQVRKSINRAGIIVKRLLFSDDDLNELVHVVKKFDKLSDDGLIDTFLRVVELHTSTHTQSEIPEWRQTTPSLTQSQVYGRRREKDRLLNLLLVPSDASASSFENFSIVLVVGIGGVGKTTLVQSVYNDPRVENHFDIMAWVCISNTFSLRRAMIEIIESANIERPPDLHNFINLGKIQAILNKGLKGKKFLIVLDDVWEKYEHRSGNIV